uniref:Uncharacterized protein n=1 Tax=Cacopsylla melanoneura TaxID=428564 RepID=A0A8D8LMX1_9HEMI
MGANYFQHYYKLYEQRDNAGRNLSHNGSVYCQSYALWCRHTSCHWLVLCCCILCWVPMELVIHVSESGCGSVCQETAILQVCFWLYTRRWLLVICHESVWIRTHFRRMYRVLQGHLY